MNAQTHAAENAALQKSASAASSLVAPDHVRQMAPYQAGKPIGEVAREYGLQETDIVKLASNENPLGMPASARHAIAIAAADLGRYPDANGFDLKRALAARYQVAEDCITLGNGSNDVLELIAHTLVSKSDEVIYAQYSFIVYALATQALGAKAVVVPAKDHGHDLDAMAKAVTDKTRLIFIANPNNPTGTYLTAAAIEGFLVKVPSRVVVVLDEAYNEYLAPELQFDSTQWLKKFPNLVVSRTFSKAYGLAGLRVGFALASAELTDLMNRVRQPFNVNSLAQAAAIAALADVDFLKRSAALNRDGLKTLAAGFDQLGLSYIPSYGNFILVKVGDAKTVNEKLLRAGVIVRPVAGYGLPEWLRVSVGLSHENQRFLAALQAIIKP
jgi:histidinol-phosphate aminotransferase